MNVRQNHHTRSVLTRGRILSPPRHQLDFEDIRPKFSGHEHAFPGCIVSDAIEHIFGPVAVHRAQQAGQINPAGDLAGRWGDSCNPVGLPDVGKQLAFHPLQFVEVVDGLACVTDLDPALFRQSLRVPNANLIRAVVHEDTGCVMGQSPAFARVGETALLPKIFQAEDEANLSLVRQLDDPVVHDGDAFAEILAGERQVLENLTGFQFHLAQRGASGQAGTLVKKTVSDFEALGESRPVMRISVDHTIPIDGSTGSAFDGGACRRLGEKAKGRDQRHNRNQQCHVDLPIVTSAVLVVYSPIVRPILSALTLAAVLLVPAFGQGAPEFEAASIRVSDPGGFHFGSGSSTGGPGTGDPGLFRCSRCTLATLISKAWDLQDYQLPGRASLSGNTFEVMARVPGGTSEADFHTMLQNLLKERFGLTGHFSEKALRGYHLVVGKNGAKLEESTGGARPAAAPQHGGFGGLGRGQGGDHGHTGVIAFGGNARYRANNQTMAELARVLSDQLGLPVDDQTGLKGKYDISLNWSGSNSQEANRGAGPGGEGHGDHGGGGAPGGTRREGGDASGPALLDAVQAQLGLRLVRADQATARVFNIDHVQQLPTAN